MKILLISQMLPYPPKGGCPQRIFNLVKECAESHEVHMLAFYRKSHYKEPSELREAISAMSSICRKIEVFEIPYEHNRFLWFLLLFFNLFSPLPYSAWVYSSRKMKEAVKRFLDAESYDVIEIGEIGLAEYARYALGTPKVLAHQNVESQLLYRRMKYVGNWFSKCYLWLQSTKLKRFERSRGRSFEFHTTVSEEDKKTLSTICPYAKIAVIPNGVDIDYFMTTDDKVEPNSIAYVGGTNWFPNYDAIMYFITEIMPRIRAEIPDVHLHCIGHQIDNRFHEMARHDRGLEVHGFVDDVRPYITRASVFIVPLRIGGGTRLKIADALSMGKAIVSTSIGCEGIKVSDGKDIVIADSPADFAKKVVELMKNPELRMQLMSNARKTAVEVYSWKKIAPLLIEVYQQAAKAGDRDTK